MICCRKLKPMVHKNKIIGFFLLIFLGWVYQLKAQSECVLYRDTLYLVTLREQQHVSKPYEVRLEPNTGQVWVKGINSFFIDSSNYENMVRSLYSNSVFGYELYLDFFHEGNYCKDYYPPVKIDTIIENYENQQDSLSQTLYFTRYQLMLHDTEYYNRDFNVIGHIKRHLKMNYYYQSLVNRSRVYTFSFTSSNRSDIRFATITSLILLNSSKSRTTRELKKLSSFIVGSYTTTSTP